MTRRAAARTLPLAAVLLLLGLVGVPPIARADGLTLALPGGASRSVGLAEIEQLPSTDEHISFLTSHGPEQGDYSGATLWAVLEHAGAIADGEPRKRLNQTLSVTGRDGFTVALALAEIDPHFEGKPVLLAWRKNGQPMESSELRLVVPGDKHGGRSVRDVVRIELRS